MESKTEPGAGSRQAEDVTPTPTQAPADAAAGRHDANLPASLRGPGL